MFEQWRRKQLDKKINNSLAIISEADERRGDYPLIVSFSGGKDSSCVLLLALQVTNDIECMFMSSGIDLPGSVEFVKQECERHNIKLHISDPVKDYMGNFIYWVKRFGYFPNIRNAYCSGRLKIRPQRAYWRKVYGYATLYKLMGVRRNESGRRMKIYSGKEYFAKDGEHSGSYIVSPIRDWSAWDVKEYLRQMNFKVNKNYTPFGVSGCYYCPFYEEKIYRKILAVYPNIYDDIIELEKELGKPSVNGNKFLGDIKTSVLSNRVRQLELI